MEPVDGATDHAVEGPARADEPARELARAQLQSDRRASFAAVSRRIRSLESRLKGLFHRFRSEATSWGVSAEWFLDNQYLIFEGLDLVRHDLDRTFVRKLVRVEGDDRPHATRISTLAATLVDEGAGRVEPELALRFLDAYQSVTPLSTAELWAFPAVLRLALLEELAECGARVLETVAPAAERRVGPPVGEGWGGPGELVDRIAGAIGSLRTAATQDWRAFVERASRVERTLRRLDPAGAYAGMDFETRDRYRKAVEVLAEQGGRSEPQVALRAVEMALEGRRVGSEADPDPGGPEVRGSLRGHVGYYLLDEGRLALEARLGVSAPVGRRIVRWARRRPLRLYAGALIALTALFWLGIAAPFVGAGGGSWTTLAILVSSLVPATTAAVAVFNWLSTRIVKPRPLPKMDFEAGLPDSIRAAVVVPCLLTDAAEARAVLRQLELNYNGNADPGIVFVLLTDHADAAEEVTPKDADLLGGVVEGVQELNRRHGREGREPFVLLHRPRAWNEGEGRWMGWERKRGKLARLNELLLHGDMGDFSCHAGDVNALTDVRYVVTLDADTFLPQGAARRLVGALSHPLNRPRFNPDGTLRRGYTVLQPRVEILPDADAPTLFSRIYEADRGLDLYSHAVSDVYQDLFRTGIFAGKGIYDVAAFHRSLDGRVPDNALLSHDLFEGVHGRAGLLTDIAVFEDFPTSLLSYMRRHHRWVRGDWQIAPWVLPRVPAPGGRSTPNPIPPLGRWQIADNLRRSLLAASLLILLTVSLVTASGWWWWGVVAAVLVLGAPSLLGVAARGRFPRRGATLSRSGPLELFRWALAFAFLPYRTAVEADAIGRTAYRLLVSRRHLLEWTTASVTSRALGGRQRLASYVRSMTAAPVVAVAVAVMVWLLAPDRLALAAGIVSTWLLAPLLAFWVSRPIPESEVASPPADDSVQRVLARRTWAYFERFVSPEHNWLPPDNHQEQPGGRTAPRTSPTNIGLGLLSTLAAYDFGYLTSAELLATLSNTLDGVDRLETHRGHLLNWYDTRTLDPLSPRYVSTVDSGNLVASLIALRAGLTAIPRESFPRERWSVGLADTLRTLGDTILGLPAEDAEHRKALGSLVDEGVRAVDSLSDRPGLAAVGALEVIGRIDDRLRRSSRASDAVQAVQVLREVRDWMRRLEQQARLVLDEMRELSPRVPDAGGSTEARGSGVAPAGLSDEDGSDEDGAPRRMSLAEIAGLDERAPERAAAAARRLEQVRELEERCSRLVDDMSFSFLYHASRRLFHIGYNVDTGALDPSYYDLLASEARLASFVAIAKRNVPSEHWLHLGRPFRKVGRDAVLLSWAGTMFEYLMPGLLMRMPRHSLLGVSCREAVERQIAFARKRRVPWGISESGYHELDDHGAYQYRAFGVPALGLRRDLGDRLVISPYASVLAWPLDPAAVTRNLVAVKAHGGVGPYGLYEAIDFGAAADGGPPGECRVVRSYMAHHQGMVLVTLDNLLHDDVMVDRFHADPVTAAVEFLLHERAPGHVRTERAPVSMAAPVREVLAPPATESWPVEVHAGLPDAIVLSNGRLSSLLTASGAGGLRWRGNAITRWHTDLTADPWGHWLLIQDVKEETSWSPMVAVDGRVEDVDVVFAPHKVEYHAARDGLVARVAVTVAAGADVEVRRVTLINEHSEPRRVHVTNYAEISLAPAGEDQRHPAFVKLFVESTFRPESQSLVFRRRPSSPDQASVFAAHTVTCASGTGEVVAWETDRERFLGRHGDMRRAAAQRHRQRFGSGASGCVLDPIQSFTVEVEIPAQGDVELIYLTSVGESAEGALSALDAYRTSGGAAWAVQRANARSQALLHGLEIPPSAVPGHQRLLSALLHPYHALRGLPSSFPDRMPQQQALWALGVSGDLPLLAVRVSSPEDTQLVLEALKTYALWREQNVAIEMVVLDEGVDGYRQPIADLLRRALGRLGRSDDFNRPRGVHYLPASRLDPLHRATVEEAARVMLDSREGDMAAHLARLESRRRDPPPFVPVPTGAWTRQATRPLPPPEPLTMHNGLGGFSAEGREYRIRLDPDTATPAPWINVIATPDLGFTVSEAGAGFTWVGNSGESRLTTWTNDPVLDRSGEAIYLRDEETADVWTPTPRPRPGIGDYEIRHGAGYTEFRHHTHGLHQRLRMFAAREPSAKVIDLEVENRWPRHRRLTVTYFAEWVLGADREGSAPHLETSFDADEQILLARDLFNELEEAGVAFLASDRAVHGWTTDRREFIGRGGSLAAPAALTRIGLDERAGLGLDPCGALQIHLSLEPGETASVRFFLGWAPSSDRVRELVGACRGDGAEERMIADVADSWERTLSRITVRTPDPAADVLLNRWLLYQALSCRLWGRSALYQSSGAFGFRDQLQDCLAFRFIEPSVTRSQILEAASRQFVEGDVLHWWHPPSGRGVRTRCSDDLLWLPFVTAAYVGATGDTAVLDEPVPYLAAAPLAEGERERYGSYVHGSERGSLYEHCLRALDRGSTRGPQGLPLMGTGDWNDALDRVGEEGEGESVWLAWFLLTTLESFAGVAEDRSDTVTARRLRGKAEGLRRRVEEVAWDGAWYIRATYDDGTPLGSSESEEARIDAISQAWAVLSGGADPSRASRAMESVWRELVREEDGLIRLLTPPFDRTSRWPGYIKAYPPGVRENGGQYTHAAVWTAWAYAKMGDGDRAWRCFELLNPVRKSQEWSDALRYRVEPYVVAADVYSEPPHVGRGGWTWYTGSASWLWRLGVEAILGLEPVADGLVIDPCIPSSWEGYEVVVRPGDAEYRIAVENPDGVCGGVASVVLDGRRLDSSRIPLEDDGRTHEVKVRLGSGATP